MNDPLDAIRDTFFEECAELIEALESGLLALQDGTRDADTVDSVFRAVHSIKGGAGAFGLTALVAFSHDFETTLHALREGRLDPSREVVAVLLRATDVLGDLVAAARTGADAAIPDTADLTALATDGRVRTDFDDLDAFEPIMLDIGQSRLGGPAATSAPGSAPLPAPQPPRRWHVGFEPLPDLLASGNEPLFLFRALEVLGRLNVTALEGDLPALVDLDVSTPRLRWSIVLGPSAPDLTETEIEAVFEFAVDLCVLEIVPLALEPERAGPVVRPGRGADRPAARPRPDAPSSAADLAMASGAATAPDGASRASATIRVDLARVDRLVNLVGELVISQSMLAQGLWRAGFDRQSEAVTTLDELQQLTRDMQDSVMAIRAQPVKSLFQRMTRIVREAAQVTLKDVRLVTEGEGTEIDKTVVERLADPLTHMIRNAIDHGLEPQDVRIAAGKSATGTIRLSARQQSDRVVIEVSDDGRGIDRARVLERAIACGLVPKGKVLDVAEVDRLLFLPGFSTSTTVTAISGRGVGMDVVQRAIRDLNGTISIASTEGRGSTISISLPLTLAILDGMIVRSNRHRMVIPLSAILETQTLSAARIETLGQGQRVVRLHDRFVPLVDLAVGMGFAAPAGDRAPEEDTALLFVQPDESGPFALQVDAIEAQRQVVIKGLGENFGHVPCVSAATILGDGQIALIVDPVGIARMSGLHPTPRLPQFMDIPSQ